MIDKGDRQKRSQEVAFDFNRLPEDLREVLTPIYAVEIDESREYLEPDRVYLGDARDLLRDIRPNSVTLSVWSPPYFVGKGYEQGLSFEDWKQLLRTVIALHFPIIEPGSFLVVNIADILCFEDSKMPRIQASVVSQRRCPVTRGDVLRAMREHPDYNRYELADLLGCSEQTIDRRLHGNNIRGGKSVPQTRVKIVGGLVEEWALDAGFYPYDRRIWVKDAAWRNSQWTTSSYKSVDEFEHLYFFWKPGIMEVDRNRLSREEWTEWGSRGVWAFPSVRANDDHEAKFPVELPRRVIRLLTEPGDIVLDCFLGSGTTAVAAIEEGRPYIGIDLVPEYVALAQDNIAKARAFT